MCHQEELVPEDQNKVDFLIFFLTFISISAGDKFLFFNIFADGTASTRTCFEGQKMRSARLLNFC